MRRRVRAESGQAMIETALALPVVLLLSVSVFEFGRAFQHWQILTNAAREGARLATLPGTTDEAIASRVQAYIEAGRMAAAESAGVDIVRNAEIAIGDDATASASVVTVTYPFQFVVLNPVLRLVDHDTTSGEALTMVASATMRNE
jgi:Flp pilus assembly protein TadG